MADGLSVVWSGLREFDAALERIAAQADQAARQVAVQGAALMEAKAKGNFSGSHKRGQPHVGGDKPNVVTGTLRRSIRSEPVVRHGLADYGTSVSPRTVYARRVELGYNGSRGYPYFEPAAREVAPLIEALAARTWAKFLKP